MDQKLRFLGINSLDYCYITSLVPLYSIKGFILSHAQSMYTEVSYQGMWEING